MISEPPNISPCFNLGTGRSTMGSIWSIDGIPVVPDRPTTPPTGTEPTGTVEGFRPTFVAIVPGVRVSTIETPFKRSLGAADTTFLPCVHVPIFTGIPPVDIKRNVRGRNARIIFMDRAKELQGRYGATATDATTTIQIAYGYGSHNSKGHTSSKHRSCSYHVRRKNISTKFLREDCILFCGYRYRMKRIRRRSIRRRRRRSSMQGTVSPFNVFLFMTVRIHRKGDGGGSSSSINSDSSSHES